MSASDADTADTMIDNYNATVSSIADALAPARTVTIRPRRSDPWFDKECRIARRSYRKQERRARRAAADSDVQLQWRRQRSDYRALQDRKRKIFWLNTVETHHHNPRRMWQVLDDLLGRADCITGSASITADDFSRFFDEKVAAVRQSTADAPAPQFTAAPSHCRLDSFVSVSVEDVISAVRSLPDKQCDSDPLPTWLLKANAVHLAPFIAQLINVSLASGQVPTALKSAYVVPRLKKPDLDDDEIKNYRPISNLPVLAKLLERIVARQLVNYLTVHGLLPRLQSAYRARHSTETALLKVTADILSALDRGDLASLALLDLSAAFDTVDHDILLQRLRVSYGIGGAALRWFQSYLGGRVQFVKYRGRCSSKTFVNYGVPQGSVLGPILFLLYTADLVALIEGHGLSPHLYADDTQIVGSCGPTDTTSLRHRIETCIADVGSWMSSNRLQLNTSKTEVMWCSSARRRHQLPADCFNIGPDSVRPVDCVRDLGLYLDSTMSMRPHITRLTSSCFGVLRQIRSIKRCLTSQARITLATCFVLARLDYCNGAFIGLPRCDLDRLQAVQNAAVRLVSGARKFDHVTPLLRDRHWLPVEQRIKFKVAVTVYKCLHGLSADYLADFTRPSATAAVDRRLRSADKLSLLQPRSRTRLGDRSFAVAGPTVWNSLPAAVTAAPSLTTFKKDLKTFLFAAAYRPNV